MPYPTPPTLNPFNASDVPNLMADGPYDAALTQIENYLAQLGAYLDAQIAAVRGEIPSSSDFATAEALEEVSKTASAASSAAASAQETATQASSAASTASGQAQEASATAATLTTNLSNLVGTLNNITVGANKLIMGINADGTGTPTSPASESIMQEASSASTVAGEALTDAEAANSYISDMKGVLASLPIKISDAGNNVETRSYDLFIDSASMGDYLNRLWRLLSNLMLAAPNDDHTQLFGYLADNTVDLTIKAPEVRSSAALTAAYESGGSGQVPISVTIDNYDREQKYVTMSTDGSVETTYAPGTIFIPTTDTRGDQGIVMLISTKSIVFEEGPDSITATNVLFDDPDNIEDNGQAKLLLIPSGPSKSASDATLTSDDLASMKRTSDGYAYVG